MFVKENCKTSNIITSTTNIIFNNLHIEYFDGEINSVWNSKVHVNVISGIITMSLYDREIITGNGIYIWRSENRRISNSRGKILYMVDSRPILLVQQLLGSILIQYNSRSIICRDSNFKQTKYNLLPDYSTWSYVNQ